MPPKKLPIPENLSPSSPEMSALVFGVIIEKLRLEAGKSPEEIAAFVDLSLPALRRIERGQQRPSPFAQTRFAQTFGITVLELNRQVELVQAICTAATRAIAYAADLRFDRELVLAFNTARARKEKRE